MALKWEITLRYKKIILLKFISLGCVCLFQTLLLCELLGCNNENWSQRDESLFQVVVFIC